ncbi:Tryptophan--tRNA ligase, chloroplastic/mitochondrial [Cymbomonas tetramitiformis]|uniref:tryptophan--tRNA ligase n=1 Tax=Cymbomonas tetramitiformis TaxID=36881 RepID=A0AAE0L2B1_9CHLO|nr:Tryptophan--tRNA ligase, chloroplastic/mitochondrial [Cymbomonas tetramitiformis]
MIQFKEKAKKQGEEANVGLGLLGYPVLMASDILLYDADLVPVGEDQRQHLELTRDIAGRINDIYGGKKWKKMGGRGGRILKVPEALIPPAGARVMSLVDGTSKMSKSAEAEGSRLNLTDTPDIIARKIKRCKTDQFEGLEFGNPDRPEATNLLTIYQLMTGMTQEEVLAEVSAMRWGDFKPILTDACVAHLSPIQERYNECMADPAYLDSVLRSGAEAANEQAERTLFKVKQAMGFMPPFFTRN